MVLGLLHGGLKNKELATVETDSFLTNPLELLSSMGLLKLVIEPPPKQLWRRSEVEEDAVANLDMEEVLTVVAGEVLGVGSSQRGCLNVNKRKLCQPQVQPATKQRVAISKRVYRAKAVSHAAKLTSVILMTKSLLNRLIPPSMKVLERDQV